AVSMEIANIEKLEILCEEFIREKVKIIEKRFNDKFKGIHFRLYKPQINGGLAECCEVTSEGVPYSNLNTASQINCGLEIINALCKHYNISAPVFIDHRECVNDIVDVDSQVINFTVTRDEKLVVKNVKELDYKEENKEVIKGRTLDF
ncbi:MAG: recombinase RecF, partial [Clostridium sp.]